MVDHVLGKAEISPYGLTNPLTKQGPGEVICDVVGDRGVVFIPGIYGRDKIMSVLQDRIGKSLDPIRGDTPQVSIAENTSFGI